MEPGPYLVVGHSYGGAVAVTFASLFPESVRGLVLIDASPPGWDSGDRAVPDDGTEAAEDLNQSCDAVADPSRNPEHLDGPAAFAGVAAISSLRLSPRHRSDRERAPFPGLAPAEAARPRRGVDAGQDHWAALSTTSAVIRVDQTATTSSSTSPPAVIEQIRRLLRDLHPFTARKASP